VSGERLTGVWRIPERELHLVPDVAGLDAIELGCGTAYWSAWRRRGARPAGIDNSERPARDRQAGCRASTTSSSPRSTASAEAVPLAYASFDLALSEYGACL
jgi:hypothetical protein